MDNQGRFVSHVGSKSGRIWSLNEGQSKDVDVHLEIPLFQFQRLRLHLWKNRKFTAPGFVIEKRGQIRLYNPNCHFKGIILDQPNSSVSISFCQGLVSFQANSIFFFLFTCFYFNNVTLYLIFIRMLLRRVVRLVKVLLSVRHAVTHENSNVHIGKKICSISAMIRPPKVLKHSQYWILMRQ